MDLITCILLSCVVWSIKECPGGCSQLSQAGMYLLHRLLFVLSFLVGGTSECFLSSECLFEINLQYWTGVNSSFPHQHHLTPPSFSHLIDHPPPVLQRLVQMLRFSGKTFLTSPHPHPEQETLCCHIPCASLCHSPYCTVFNGWFPGQSATSL